MSSTDLHTVQVLGSCLSANLKSIAGTSFHAFTVPAGRRCVLTEVYPEGATTDNVTVSAILNLGSEDGAAQDWYDSIAVPPTLSSNGGQFGTGFTEYWSAQGNYSGHKVFEAGESVGFTISTPATATTCIADVYFVGFYIS